MGKEPPRSATLPSILVCWVLALLLLGLIQLITPSHWKKAAAPDYGPSVESLLEGRPFLDLDGKALVRFPPLFPLLLATEFKISDRLGWSRVAVGQTVAAILIATSTTLVFVMVSWFVPLPLAILASLFVVGMPHLLFAAFLNLSVVPFLVCFLAASLSLLLYLRSSVTSGTTRVRNHLFLGGACGLFLGSAMLLRPIALYLPLLFVPVLLLSMVPGTPRSSLTRFAAPTTLLLALTLTVLPWEWWAHRQTGTWIPLSSAGSAALRDGISFNHKSWRQPLPFGPRLSELQTRISAAYPDLQTGGDVLRLVTAELQRDPLAISQLYALKIARSWYGTDTQNRRNEAMLRWIALAYIIPTIWAGATFIGTLVGTFRHRGGVVPSQRFARWAGWFALAIILYFWAVTAIVTTLVRYMIPAFTMMPVLWAAALHLRERQRLA